MIRGSDARYDQEARKNESDKALLNYYLNGKSWVAGGGAVLLIVKDPDNEHAVWLNFHVGENSPL